MSGEPEAQKKKQTPQEFIIGLVTKATIIRKGAVVDPLVQTDKMPVDDAFDLIDEMIEKGDIGEFTFKLPGGKLRSYLVPKDTSIITTKAAKRTA